MCMSLSSFELETRQRELRAMLKEVGFWRDARALDRSQSSVVDERSSLLSRFTASASFSFSAVPDDKTSEDGDDGADSSGRPDPTRLVDHRWFVMNSQVVNMLEWYLVDGACVESHELAFSYCRFQNCPEARRDPKQLGACTLTDGVYVWPEGYWHYIRYHHVRPPQEFLDHVVASYRRALLAAKALAREFGDDVLFLWDAEFKQPVPMPSGMQQWIITNTTLQLPGSKHIHKPQDRQLWDQMATRLPSCCGCCIS